MLFNLLCHNGIILSCFFFFFIIVDLYFLVSEAIAQHYDPTAELVIPLVIRTKQAKAEIETCAVTI